MTSLTFKLPDELLAEIKAAAKADCRTISDFMRRHITATLNKPARKTRK